MSDHRDDLPTNSRAADDSGSFGLGFALGAALGAAGMFFFRTERGKQLRDHLEEEWRDARAHLLTQGEAGGYDTPPTLREAVLDAYDAFKREFLQDISQKKSTTPPSEDKKTGAKPQRFKGV